MMIEVETLYQESLAQKVADRATRKHQQQITSSNTTVYTLFDAAELLRRDDNLAKQAAIRRAKRSSTDFRESSQISSQLIPHSISQSIP
jgi:hypothetical protein